jgi:type VI secretion system secreted protein Hcp
MSMTYKLHKFLRTILVLALAVTGASAVYADEMCVRIDGLTGKSTGMDCIDGIVAVGFAHGVVVPTDSSTGKVSGNRVHQPLRFYKEFDRFTPRLYQALVVGERLPSLVVEFMHQGYKGNETYYTIELGDVMISEISAKGGDDGATPREEVKVLYRSIRWVDQASGAESRDYWQ